MYFTCRAPGVDALSKTCKVQVPVKEEYAEDESLHRPLRRGHSPFFPIHMKDGRDEKKAEAYVEDRSLDGQDLGCDFEMALGGRTERL